MNKRAKELGMENTNFLNTNGLDDDGHYSSARDVAIMSRELLKHDKIFIYTTIWMDEIRGGKFQLANTNKLIRFYKGANGLKTGSTSKALCCLSASAKRDDMQLIAVILGSPTSDKRFEGAKKLLDYGFANYKIKTLTTKDEYISDAVVINGVNTTVKAISKEGKQQLSEKNNNSEIEKRVSVNDKILAPVKKGDILGKVEFIADNNVIDSIEIVASDDVAKKGVFLIIKDLIYDFM